MINEVDGALRNLVEAEVVGGADVEVLFEAPTRDWASRRNAPAVDLYLYDIREDTNRRVAGMVQRRDDRGVVVERESLPRYFKLAYLITAWTQRPEDEHRLLSAVLACFLRYDVLPEPVLTPLLRDLGLPLGTQVAYPPPEDRQVSDVWSSLGGDLKPSVDLVITVAIRPERLYDIAQAVMAPLRLRAVSQVTYEADDGIRQLPGRTGVHPAEGPAAHTRTGSGRTAKSAGHRGGRKV
jgi:hypothetical protein